MFSLNNLKFIFFYEQFFKNMNSRAYLFFFSLHNATDKASANPAFLNETC